VIADLTSKRDSIIEFVDNGSIARVIDRAKTAIISPRDTAELGGIILDLENDLSEEKTLRVTSKAVESGFSVSENAEFELAVVNLSGTIAQHAFQRNMLGKAADIAGEIGRRVQMVGGYFLNDLFPEQMNQINNTIGKAETGLAVASQKWDMLKGLATGENSIISGGNVISRAVDLVKQIDAMFDTAKIFQFECEFCRYPQMIITRKTVRRDPMQRGVFHISLTMQEWRGVELEVANLDSALFERNLCRTDIQMRTGENAGQQKPERMDMLPQYFGRPELGLRADQVGGG